VGNAAAVRPDAEPPFDLAGDAPGEAPPKRRMSTVGLGVGLVVVAYVLGSVPVGLLVGRLLGGVDPRREGSGRTGATNVLRSVGIGGAAVVLLLDITKGVVAVLLAGSIFATTSSAGAPWVAAAAGVAAVIGHIRSIFIGFGGGRGVATAAGGLLAMTPWSVLILAPILVAIIWRTRYVSLGSISAALLAPFVAGGLALAGVATAASLAYALGAGALVTWSHADNITRLRAGTERRLGEKAPAPVGAVAEGKEAR
jgi:glycerol-3-phosphate acyltransferase PlsY